MGIISDKLLYLKDTKLAIKNSLISKGISVPTGTTFREYATKINQIETAEYQGSDIADVWVRPTEWLALPDNIDGVQKVSILNAVFDTDSEFVALLCRGAYTIDWGDGTVENFADNIKAEHKYTYSDVDLNSDTVATFGYKQCIITITPQSGQNLTNIHLDRFHSSIGSNISYDLTTGFLDIRINAPLCTILALTLGASSYVKHTMMQQCLIGELADTALNELFYDCYSLQSVTIKDTSNVTSFNGMHYNNYALQKMPAYTFRSAGVDVVGMFYNCYSLVETYPIVVNISGSSSIINMFLNCKALRYISLSINSNINYVLTNTFTGCVSLETIKLTLTGIGRVTSLSGTFQSTRINSSPAIDTSLCVYFDSAFKYCDRLTNLYEYNYSSATTLANMLDGCYSLKSVPNFNITASCTSLASLCINCWSLEKAPTFSNSSGVTNIGGMLSGCKSITTIPSYVFGAISSTYMSSAFSAMDSLQSMPSITVGNVYTANTSFISTSYSLKRMLMPLRFTFSVANAKMSSTALNEMYSILPTVTGQTVTVTGNYGLGGSTLMQTGTTTVGSNVITGVSNTALITVGKIVTGTGITTNTATACTFTSSGALVTSTAHGLVDGNIVSFQTQTGGISGLIIKDIYYVINATADTFQVSSVLGGSARPIFFSASGTYITPAFVTDVVTNTSVTLSTPCVSAGTSTISYYNEAHKFYLATMKGWTVTR